MHPLHGLHTLIARAARPCDISLTFPAALPYFAYSFRAVLSSLAPSPLLAGIALHFARHRSHCSPLAHRSILTHARHSVEQLTPFQSFRYRYSVPEPSIRAVSIQAFSSPLAGATLDLLPRIAFPARAHRIRCIHAQCPLAYPEPRIPFADGRSHILQHFCIPAAILCTALSPPRLLSSPIAGITHTAHACAASIAAANYTHQLIAADT
jgi:hypothetical protein